MQQKLEALRTEINQIDQEIIKLLAARQKRIMAIGSIKAKTGLQVRDASREAQLMKSYKELSGQYDLNAEYVQRVFKIILHYSRQSQQHYGGGGG